MKYHTLFVIFGKTAKFLNCRLLQIISGALWVKAITNSFELLVALFKSSIVQHFDLRNLQVASLGAAFTRNVLYMSSSHVKSVTTGDPVIKGKYRALP